jgi:hypothetical protein
MQSKRTLTRRRLLATAGALVAGVALAACGETRLPDLSDLPKLRSAALETPITVTTGTDVTPRSTQPVKVAVRAGNFLVDRVAVQLSALATDPKLMAAAPAPLTIVTMPEAGRGQVEDMAQGLDSVLPSHPDLDAIVLPNAALAFGLADSERV